MTKLEQFKNELLKSLNDINDIKFTDAEKNNLFKQHLQRYNDFQAFMKSEIENKHDFNKILYEASESLRVHYKDDNSTNKGQAAAYIALVACNPGIWDEKTVEPYNEIYQYTLENVASVLVSNYTYNEKFKDDPLDFETIVYHCIFTLETMTFPKYL